MLLQLQERLTLLQLPAFRWFVLSRFLSTLATGMTYIIMTWFLLDKDNQLSAIAILMMCFWRPSVVAGSLAGVMVDRFSQKRLLIITNGMRTAAYLVFALSPSNKVTPFSVYMLALFQGLVNSIQDPLQAALVRKMISDRDLVYANTTLDIVYELGNVGGMGLAGFFMLMLSFQHTILSLSLLILCATLFSSLIKIDQAHVSPHHTLRTNWLNDFISSLAYLKNQKLLCVLYLMQLLIMIEFMTVPILVAYYAKNILQATSAQYGAIEAALSVGVVLGGLLMPWCVKKAGEKPVALTGAFGCIIIFLLLEFGHSILLTQGVYFVFGLCLMVWPLILTNAQRLTRPDYQGRISAFFNCLSGIIQKLVLRSPVASLEEGINRQAELYNTHQAARAGICHPFVYFDEQTGICLREFIDGHAPVDDDDNILPDALSGIADVLKKIHALPSLFLNLVDNFLLIKNTVQHIKRYSNEPIGIYENLLKQADEVHDCRMKHPVALVPCHNDPNPRNFLVTPEQNSTVNTG